jgi:hypothetical protein
MRALLLSSIVALAVIGCSAASPSRFTEGAGAGNGTGADSGNGGASTSSGLGAGFATGTGVGNGGGPPACTTAAELVYVLSVDNKLWSFDPGQKQFTLIGPLGCNVPDGATPNSMAVDRNATAWVNYVASNDIDPITGDPVDSAGYVYQVSTTDGSCAAKPTVTLPDPSWYRLGMGFSTDAVGGTAETLYVAGTGTGEGQGSSPGLATIDLTKGTLKPVSQFTGDPKLSGQSAELTGTGDARLFGFFTTDPVRVAEIATNSAAIKSDSAVNSVPVPMAWAFSFWGGAFYLYTSDGTSDSTVTRFDPTTNTVDSSYVLTAPAVIDGAGVSTCAPLKPTT